MKYQVRRYSSELRLTTKALDLHDTQGVVGSSPARPTCFCSGILGQANPQTVVREMAW